MNRLCFLIHREIGNSFNYCLRVMSLGDDYTGQSGSYLLKKSISRENLADYLRQNLLDYKDRGIRVIRKVDKKDEEYVIGNKDEEFYFIRSDAVLLKLLQRDAKGIFSILEGNVKSILNH